MKFTVVTICIQINIFIASGMVFWLEAEMREVMVLKQGQTKSPYSLSRNRTKTRNNFRQVLIKLPKTFVLKVHTNLRELQMK